MSKKMQSADIFDIDCNRLDEEWINQPALFHEHATNLAEANKELAEAKAQMEVVKAEVDKHVRADPVSYGLEKVTEVGIEKAVLASDEYSDARAEYIEAQYEVDMCWAAVNSLNHRKSALERLVSLHGQDYFSVPHAHDKEGREVADDIKKKSVRRRRGKRK